MSVSTAALSIPVPVRPPPSSAASSVWNAGAGSWAPAGLYVPVHRRMQSSSSSSSGTSTAPTSAPSSPGSVKPSLPSEPRTQSPPYIYTPAALLALAPASLMHASLQPVVTPELAAAFPKVFRPHGGGIIRALALARVGHGCGHGHAYEIGEEAQVLQPESERTRRRTQKRNRRRRSSLPPGADADNADADIVAKEPAAPVRGGTVITY